MTSTTKAALIARTMAIIFDGENWSFPAKIISCFIGNSYGLFGWRGEGGGVWGSRVLLAKNKLILC